MATLLTLILVALSVAVSNFAGSVAIGVGDPDLRQRLRVGLAFGFFEGAMPLVGLVLGRALAGTLGHWGHLLAGALLVAVGLYTIWEAVRAEEEEERYGAVGWQRLLLIAFALSIDNLAAGFALGVRQVPFLLAAAVMAAVSVVLTVVGLEVGKQIGIRAGSRSEIGAGGVLILVGVGLATGLLH